MVIAMTKRGFVIVLNVGIFVLLLILVMEAAGIRRSLRRIEREERALVHGQADHFPSPKRLGREVSTPTRAPIRFGKTQRMALGSLSLRVHAQIAAGPSIIDFSPKRVARAHSPSGALRLTSSGCGKPQGPFLIFASPC